MEFHCTESFYKFNEVYEERIDPKDPTSQYKYRQLIMVGGSRSSKSYSIMQKMMLYLMQNKNKKVTVWRDLKNVCRQTIMEDFKKIIMFNSQVFRDFKHNKTEGSFTYLPTKSRIIFDGTDNIGKVLGGAQDISVFNEVNRMTEEVFKQVAQRTADRVICDYNPASEFFIEKFRLEARTIFIHSTFLDNAYCPPEIVIQLNKSEPWESGSYEVDSKGVYYNGQPIAPNNQPPPHLENVRIGTADEYHWMVYGLGLGAEKPNKIYRGWKPIELDVFESLEYKSYFGLDFGTASPTACMELKYDGDGTFYICERLYKPLGDINESLTLIIQTDVPQIEVGKSIVICDSQKDLYIQLLRAAGYMALAAIKGQGSIEVGISLVQSFNIRYVPAPNLVSEYNNYSFMLDRYDKSTDKPKATDDHLLDALRYCLSYMVKHLNIKF
jgi:PBSX family phage terminase large subunit